MSKVTKDLWDEIQAIEHQLHSLSAFVQNPVELSSEELTIFLTGLSLTEERIHKYTGTVRTTLLGSKS